MILITGGLGYLGARIAENLLKSGLKVRIASSRNNPYVPEQLKSCEIIKIDLTNQNSLNNACKGIISVIHLAALNAKECEIDPNKAKVINSEGTLKLLKSSLKNKVSCFLYFSTSHVYGPQLSGIVDEKNPYQECNSYSKSHKIAEDYVLNFNTENLTTTVFRLSNVIGSPLYKDTNCWMLIANDISRKIVMNKQPVLYAQRKTLRDFVPISDVIHNTSLIFKSSNNLDIGGQIYNISSSSNLSLDQLCNLILLRSEAIFGIKLSIKYLNPDLNVINDQFIISNQKAGKIGFAFKNDLNKEIDEMLINFNNWFGNLSPN